MTTCTSKELLRMAQFLSNTRTSDNLSFEFATNLLNSQYRELYQQVAENGDNYTKFAEVGENGQPLPNDCYEVLAAYSGNIDDGGLISRAPQHEFVPGQWRIINNCFYLDGKQPRFPVWIKYVTMPPTLTVPNESVLLEFAETPVAFGRMTGRYIYYQGGENFHKYDLDAYTDSEIEEADYKTPLPLSYKEWGLSFDVVAQTLTAVSSYDGTTEDWTDLVARDNVTIKNIVTDSPYMMVSYSDGLVYVFTDLYGVNWNIKQISGHDTLGEVLAMRTNDRTGRGCIFLDADDDEYYYASFVPDTILSYPDNTFMQLLQYKLAVALMGQNGMDNPAVEDQMRDAELQFYKTLSKHNNIQRVTNITSRRWYRG